MRKVGIIGPTAAYNLFGQSSPVNKIVRINGIGFKIIGLTASKGSSGFDDADDQIFVPISTAHKRVFGVDYLRAISAQAKSIDKMDDAASQIEQLLQEATQDRAGE